MPKRSAIETLPEKVKSKLQRKLVERGFSGYSDLAEWLAEQGFEISRSAVHRYGSAFEESLKRAQLSSQMAFAFASAVPDDEGKLNQATIRMLQDRIFGLLVDLDAGEVEPKTIASLTRAVSELSRADVNLRVKMSEIRTRTEEAAKEADKIVKSAGLSEEQASMIRAHILGITGNTS